MLEQLKFMVRIFSDNGLENVQDVTFLEDMTLELEKQTNAHLLRRWETSSIFIRGLFVRPSECPVNLDWLIGTRERIIITVSHKDYLHVFTPEGFLSKLYKLLQKHTTSQMYMKCRSVS